MRQCILGIFAKEPWPGRVKTRLAVKTDEGFAARLAEAFLRDSVARYRTVADKRMILFTPAESQHWFEELAGGIYTVESQAAGDLGERLSAFFSRWRGARVVVIGTDSPNLPLDWVRLAFLLLEENEVVLGPAMDGGYYLIAMKEFFPGLFRIADWGGKTVFAQTLDRVHEAGLRLGLLPVWYDVDTVEDAIFLKNHLRAQRLAGEVSDTPRTEEVLREWDPVDPGNAALIPGHDV